MIVIKNLSAVMSGEPLFEKVNVTFGTNDRIGIVGPNGSGKSTFLKIIAGLLESDAGTVQTLHERIGYLPQDLEFTDSETIESYLADVPPAALPKAIKKVGLQALPTSSKVRDLSGGQKRRLALAKVLGHGPTFLLLDEPTNHLDRATIEWLEEFLQEFNGGVVLVSHDRSLLDNVTTKILEINSREACITEFVGNYNEYLIERAKRDELQNEARERQQKEKKRLELWLARKREEAKIYDSPSKGKMIRAKEKYLQRGILDKEIHKAGPPKKIKGVTLEGDVAAPKLVCRFTHIAKNFGDTRVLRDVSFDVRGSEHVLLAGANGSGKTTLLKMLMGKLEPDEGSVKLGPGISVGYFEQEHESLDLKKTVLEEYEETDNLLGRKSARAVLGSFLFSENDVYKKVASLSLGERVRLIFAKLTNQKNQLLVLDEPTNHLDIASREVIEAALLEYEGSIIAVSHDRYFIDKIGFDRVVEIRGGVEFERETY